MNFKKVIKKNGVEYEITFHKNCMISTQILCNNLLFVEKNKHRFINDLSINRYMKKLQRMVRKNMVTAATQGFGSSAGFYYISAETLIQILENEIKIKEFDKAKAIKMMKRSFEFAIETYKKDIEYFSQDKFKGKYFSLNGQHRMESIIDDLNGDLGKQKTQIDYSPYYINNEAQKFDSLHDLKKKLTSANDDERFEAVRGLSIKDGQDAYEKYLESCEIYIFEVTHAESFEAISEYIWFSNSSTSWARFEHAFKHIKNPFTTYVMHNIASNETNKSSVTEELIYDKSGINWKDGKFKKNGGGFEYLLGLIYDTCYNPDSLNLLSKFGFRGPDELLKTILSPDFVTEQSKLEDFKTIVVSVSKVLEKLSKETKINLPIVKATIKRPSTFINSIFLIRYLEEIYSYKANNGNTYKVKVKQDNYESIIKDYITIAIKYSNEMDPINTYYWETDDARELLQSMGQTNPITSKDSIKDPAFYGKFEEILQLCKKHKRDKSDNTVAFLKHIGDSFVFGWNKDHECVVNIIKTHLDGAFKQTMEKLKPEGIFADLEWVDSTPLVDSKYLVSTESDADFKDSIWSNNKHRGHGKSKSKGGSNKVENLELEDADINVRTKNVV